MATADVNIYLAALTLKDKIINGLIELINSYKTKIINRFRELHEILADKQTSLMEELDNILTDVRTHRQTQRQTNDDQLRQLYETKELVQTKLTHDRMNIVLQNTLNELQDNINKLDNDILDIPMVDVKFDITLFNTAINNICIEIGKRDYKSRNKPTWFTASKGRELKYPQGLAVDKDSGDIYIVDANPTLTKNDFRIQIYNNIGEYVRTISSDYDGNILWQFYRILIDAEYCYLTCNDRLGNLLIKINKLSECIDTRTYRVNLSHHGINDFMFISGMDLDNINIFICMGSNEILVINKTNLKITNTIQLQMEHFHEYNPRTLARDIKLLPTEMIILFNDADYPLQCFSREGVLLRTIISNDQIKFAKYFCMDIHNNYIISDFKDNNIKIFSPSGKLITSIGKTGQGIGKPQGISLDLNNRIIICDNKNNYMLQAF